MAGTIQARNREISTYRYKKSVLSNLQIKNVLPVYKDQTGELILPTENIIIGIRKNATRKQIEILAIKYGLKLMKINSPMPGMALLTVPPEKYNEIIELSNKLRNDPKTRWAQSDFITPHYKRNQHPKYNRQITPYLQYGVLINDPLF